MVQFNNLDRVLDLRDLFKKEAIFIILLCNLFFVSCQKDNDPMEQIIGKWKSVKGYNPMGGIYFVDTENQRIEIYTRDNMRILYDYLGNEIARCNFRATKSIITIYGEEINGTKWENSYKYWFSNDTLKIRNDGGFEFYDEFLIRVK